MHVAVRRPRVGEHVRRHHGHAFGTAALGDGALRHAVDGRFLHHHRAQVSVLCRHCAGVDARAAGDIEQALSSAEIQRPGHRGAEIDAAAIHRCGELPGERLVLHRPRPVLLILVAAPVRGAAGLQHAHVILADRALLQRGVVGAEKPR